MKLTASTGADDVPAPKINWSLQNRSLSLDSCIMDTVDSSRPFSGGRWANVVDHDWIVKGPFLKDPEATSMALTAGQDWYGRMIHSQEAVNGHVAAFRRFSRVKWRIGSGRTPIIVIPAAEKQYGVAVDNVCSEQALFIPTEDS